jgi:hypothetical protein
MPHSTAQIDPRLSWAERIRQIGADHGLFARLDARHMALMVDEDSDTLLISFDRADYLWSQGAAGLPLGFPAVPAHGISFLSLMSVGRTWFESLEFEAFIEGLTMEGFFASYARIFVLAAGPDCGYAAARAITHIPGAQVVLARPASSMDAALPSIESRFSTPTQAPKPLGATALARAMQATILFDPSDPIDAAQTAVFRSPNIVRVAIPLAGAGLVRALRNTKTLLALTNHLINDTLAEPTAYALLRDVLQSDPAYRARLVRPN